MPNRSSLRKASRSEASPSSRGSRPLPARPHGRAFAPLLCPYPDGLSSLCDTSPRLALPTQQAPRPGCRHPLHAAGHFGHDQRHQKLRCQRPRPRAFALHVPGCAPEADCPSVAADHFQRTRMQLSTRAHLCAFAPLLLRQPAPRKKPSSRGSRPLRERPGIVSPTPERPRVPLLCPYPVGSPSYHDARPVSRAPQHQHRRPAVTLSLRPTTSSMPGSHHSNQARLCAFSPQLPGQPPRLKPPFRCGRPLPERPDAITAPNRPFAPLLRSYFDDQPTTPPSSRGRHYSARTQTAVIT